MKTIKTILLMCMLLTIPAAFVACEEEEPTTVEEDCLGELEGLADVLYNSSMTFSNNPTSSNCSSVRTAALNLINAAENCGYGYLYEDQTQFWLDYDCSEFD